MTLITTDIQNLYQRQFGKKPIVPELVPPSKEEPGIKINGQGATSVSSYGSALTADYRGQEIWLPIKFFELDVQKFGASQLLIPYAVIRLSAKKLIVETPMVERQGTVKEQYSIEDYDISIKGFVTGYDATGKYPIWPEAEITVLKNLYEISEAVKLDNALTNIWIGGDHRVVLYDVDFPEVEGGRKNFRPFTMKIKSDTIFTLEVE